MRPRNILAASAKSSWIWADDVDGLIDWEQRNELAAPFGMDFLNPSFSATRRIDRGTRLPGRGFGGLLPTLRRTLDVGGPVLVKIAIDYRGDLRLTARLGARARSVKKTGQSAHPGDQGRAPAPSDAPLAAA